MDSCGWVGLLQGSIGELGIFRLALNTFITSVGSDDTGTEDTSLYLIDTSQPPGYWISSGGARIGSDHPSRSLDYFCQSVGIPSHASASFAFDAISSQTNIPRVPEEQVRFGDPSYLLS